MDHPVSDSELKDLRENAVWERDHVGAPGCLTRTRAETLLKLIEAYSDQARAYRELEGEHAKLQGRLIDNP